MNLWFNPCRLPPWLIVCGIPFPPGFSGFSIFFAFHLPPHLPPFGFSLGKVLTWASDAADVLVDHEVQQFLPLLLSDR